jgi:DNA-binding transcriptional MocR family regulator
MLYRCRKFKSVMQHSYNKLAQLLIDDIKAARFRVGEKLPSIRKYAEQHSVSASTAIRCYRHLEQKGYVLARPKSGIYVADWKELQRKKNSKTFSHTTSVSAQKQPLEYEKLISIQHRMSQLYGLTNSHITQGFHLATADPRWYPNVVLARITQRILRDDPNIIGRYPTGSGLPALKQAISDWLGECGVDVPPADWLITHGSTEALNLALRAVAKPGDAVIVESPVYFGLLQLIDSLGLRAIEIPLNDSTGMSLEALQFALENHSNVKAIIVMPCLQNPSGSVMPDTKKRRLLKIAEHFNLPIIEDDAFGDASGEVDAANPGRLTPIKAWDKSGRVIYCGTCSKSIAPGFRVGWINGGRYQRQLENLKLSNTLVCPLLEQTVLAEFIASGAHRKHLKQFRQKLGNTAFTALSAVKKSLPKDTKVLSAANGWWLWLELKESSNALTILQSAITHGMAFAPGIVFSGTGKFSNHMRINIARPYEDGYENFFQVLGRLIDPPT